MKTTKIKVARIGNSRGIRFPAVTLRRYRIGDAILMEERSDCIVLRPEGASMNKLSWGETAREMAEAGEDWGEWQAAAADGLDEIPWNPGEASRVAERKTPYVPRRRRGVSK